MTRIRYKFARHDPLKHISHLDMMRLFQRALRRSGLPLLYSQGFNPHLRFNLAAPLPVNVTASEEYGEVFFSGTVSPGQFITALRGQLPVGLELTGACIEDNDAPSLPSLISAALYTAKVKPDQGCHLGIREYRAALNRLLEREEILAPRPKKKKKNAYTNVRPYIVEACFNQPETGKTLELHLLLQSGSKGGISPFFVIEQLEKELSIECANKAQWELHREKLYQKQDQFLQPLSEGM